MAELRRPERIWRIGKRSVNHPLPANHSKADPPVNWSAKNTAVVAEELASDLRDGLDDQEAGFRLQRDGSNIIAKQPKQHLAHLILAQFNDAMIMVLLVAAVIAAIVGELRDAAMIALILVINAAIGLFHELRAQKAVAALKLLVPHNVTVVRSGTPKTIHARDLVYGDLVQLEVGRRVPADIRLIEIADLEVDEAPLTGESLSTEKVSAPIKGDNLPLGDQINMAFAGTTISRGTARGLVVATGIQSEIGKIADMMQHDSPALTPLQQRLAQVSRKLAIAAIFVCLVIFAVGLLQGHPPLIMFMTAASVAVAAMPEALPAVVTVLLAVGARKMAHHNALIRQLPAVETLGSVTYICTDKTGTLTQNDMQVADIVADNRDEILVAMALCTEVDGAGKSGDEDGPRGEPTEIALAVYAAEMGLERYQLEQSQPRVATFAFTSARKRMTTIHANNGSYLAYTKGAPEIVLKFSEEWQAIADTMAGKGMRVLAFARRQSTALPASDDIDQATEILGLVGLRDPARPESAAAIASCMAAGIKPVMITGDHPETARPIATEIGLANAEDEAITGPQLAQLSVRQFDQLVLDAKIYARVDPAQKIRIVEALQNKNQFVAMTGDGINDAPALSRANIGVAMGKVGTDVAREAADIILLDDNFASIVRAVREGRRVFDNIRKFIRYVLACNLAEILTIFFAPLVGLPLPLLPVQILWINLVTDGLPGLALAAEKAEPDVMQRPPMDPDHGIFDRDMWLHIMFYGGFMAAVTIGTQYWALETQNDSWQTMVFTVLTFLQLGQAVAVRSESKSIFRSNPFDNPFLIAAILISVALHLTIVYTPMGQKLFGASALTWMELAFCFLASLAGLILSEVWKLFKRSRSH